MSTLMVFVAMHASCMHDMLRQAAEQRSIEPEHDTLPVHN
jgi:hypothetical protein